VALQLAGFYAAMFSRIPLGSFLLVPLSGLVLVIIGLRIFQTLAFLPDLDYGRTQALANITQEISRQGIKPGTRKINGRYIHSHLVSRLRGKNSSHNHAFVLIVAESELEAQLTAPVNRKTLGQFVHVSEDRATEGRKTDW